MPTFEETPIEDVARRFLQAKASTVQALADELGVSRQTLHKRVNEFLEANPAFAESQTAKGKGAA